MSRYQKNLLVLHITVLIFGLTGIFGRLLEGLGSLNTVFYRVVIGALGMFAYAIWTKKSLKIASFKNLARLAGVGVVICCLLYTSDAADDLTRVYLWGGRARITQNNR